MLYGSSKIELKQLTAEGKRHLHRLSELSRDLYNLFIDILKSKII